jgi:hypothetical protein
VVLTPIASVDARITPHADRILLDPEARRDWTSLWAPWVSVEFGPDAELEYITERVTSAGFVFGEELDTEGTTTQVFGGPDGFEVWVEPHETRIDVTTFSPRES